MTRWWSVTGTQSFEAGHVAGGGSSACAYWISSTRFHWIGARIMDGERMGSVRNLILHLYLSGEIVSFPIFLTWAIGVPELKVWEKEGSPSLERIQTFVLLNPWGCCEAEFELVKGFSSLFSPWESLYEHGEHDFLQCLSKSVCHLCRRLCVDWAHLYIFHW